MSGYYAKPTKRILSQIAIIDSIAINAIASQLPPPEIELTSEQLTEIASQIDMSGKVDKITGYSLVQNTEIAKIHTSGSDNQDLSNLVIKEIGKSLIADIEIAKIHTAHSDDQDLSGKVDKETGKGLSTNDYTTGEKEKLAGLNNYTHPANHSPSIITQDVSNRFVSDTEKSTWNGKETGGAVASHESSYVHANIVTAYNHSQAAHAPSNAQKNSDILKSEIETVLIGEISTHSHAGGGGGLSQQQIEGLI